MTVFNLFKRKKEDEYEEIDEFFGEGQELFINEEELCKAIKNISKSEDQELFMNEEELGEGIKNISKLFEKKYSSKEIEKVFKNVIPLLYRGRNITRKQIIEDIKNESDVLITDGDIMQIYNYVIDKLIKQTLKNKCKWKAWCKGENDEVYHEKFRIASLKSLYNSTVMPDLKRLSSDDIQKCHKEHWCVISGELVNLSRLPYLESLSVDYFDDIEDIVCSIIDSYFEGRIVTMKIFEQVMKELSQCNDAIDKCVDMIKNNKQVIIDQIQEKVREKEYEYGGIVNRD